MAKQTPKSYSFSGTQKTLLGIAIAFYAIYKFVLKDPDIIKNLGIGYPWFIMLWVMIMLVTAGLSGFEFAIYLASIVKDKIKKPE